MKLKIIIASTRPGRKGPIIADWFFDVAKKHVGFETELVDLATINLPLLDEPNHPRLGKYEKEHTKIWSKIVADADAFVFVTPEYNFSFPASIKNALDFLFNEWQYKPVGFVSYGGVSGGLRCVQMLKQVVTSLKMMPLVEAVTIPMFTQYIKENGHFEATEMHLKSAEAMLAELNKWTNAMLSIRE
ncbi:MAG: NADPH-dependent oxidoreductase [Sphingobacteriales bacterium]|nr:MAG: NADPH-dependent oxidoreductase [Sphingobacteriales bacterium]